MARFWLLRSAGNFLFFTAVALKQKQLPIRWILWSKAETAWSWPLTSIHNPRALYQHIAVSDIRIILLSRSQVFHKILFGTEHICWCCSFICQDWIIYVINFTCISNIIRTLGMLQWQAELLHKCFHVMPSTETSNVGKNCPWKLIYFISRSLSVCGSVALIISGNINLNHNSAVM